MSDTNMENIGNGGTYNTAPAAPVKDVRLGDGVMNVAKTEANERMQEFAAMSVNMFFDFLEGKVKDIPEAIKRLRNNPKTNKEFATFWSEQLYKKGLISEVEKGLPDDMMIHNIHQHGYNEGLYVGYLITMMALAEKGISKEELLAAREMIIPRMLARSYEDRKELVEELEGEMKKWTEAYSFNNKE